MDIPIVIHKDADSVYGVTVPDVPGCFSWGDTIEEAMKNAQEAIFSHFETLLELDEDIELDCSGMEQLVHDPAYADDGWKLWALVDVDLATLDKKPERINVSIPRFVLHKIDSYVGLKHETRSGFLSRAALTMIAQESGTSRR